VPSGTLGYQPNSGEEVHVVEIPPEFEKLDKLADVHTNFRVEVSASGARLVSVAKARFLRDDVPVVPIKWA
jgi:hypothetical protein